MSLHRFIVPPPLALAVHPAPAPLPRPERKTDDKDKAKDKAAGNGKANEDDKDKAKPKAEDAKDKPKEEAKAEDEDNLQRDKAPDTEAVVAAIAKSAAKIDPSAESKEIPEAPASATSMIPEPPTPVPGVEQVAKNPAATPRIAAATGDDAIPAAQVKEDAVPPNKGDGAQGPIPKDDSDADTTPPPPPPLPIRLIGPAPPRPLRTTLDLHPDRPYPLIISDPRGAYHQYAKYMQGEVIYVDVTKDGWLFEQWKERPEREALARLRGESEKQHAREVEADKKRREMRKVPPGAEELLLHLWNDLVQAPSYELPIDTFWAKYEWEDPTAQKHLSSVQRTDKESSAPVLVDGQEIEWTKEGVEEILAAIGVHFIYNTEKPLIKSDYSPGSSLLILGHGHFMLRPLDSIQFKPESASGKFEVLITDHHDRVFGEMVKAQIMEERKKKELAYRKMKKREAEEKEKKKELEEGNKDEVKQEEDKGKDDNREKEEKVSGEVKDNVKAVAEPKAESITSNEKVKDGDPVRIMKTKDGRATVVEGKGVAVSQDGERIVLALPVAVDGAEAPRPLDAKHEAAGVIVAPEAPQDGGRKTNMGPGLDDVELAVRALDAAVEGVKVDLVLGPQAKDKEKEQGKEVREEKGKEDKKEKEKVPYIWTWIERADGICEKWRWGNYAVGLHNISPGGWEERDWKVFADGRGVEEFEEDEEEEELIEEDVHDWSC